MDGPSVHQEARSFLGLTSIAMRGRQVERQLLETVIAVQDQSKTMNEVTSNT